MKNQQNQSNSPRGFAPLLILIVVVVLVLIGVAAITELRNKKPSTAQASNQAPASSAKWVKYNDSTLGFTFSYPENWHIKDAKATEGPSGRTIYLGPNAIISDSETLVQQHLDDPQLGLYVYDTNPAGNLDNQPITSPDTKVGTITLSSGKSSALIEDKLTSYDDTVTLSACPDAYCTFKVKNVFLSPTIRTLGSVVGLDGHDIDKSGSIYKTELKILESINY